MADEMFHNAEAHVFDILETFRDLFQNIDRDAYGRKTFDPEDDAEDVVDDIMYKLLAEVDSMEESYNADKVTCVQCFFKDLIKEGTVIEEADELVTIMDFVANPPTIVSSEIESLYDYYINKEIS